MSNINYLSDITWAFSITFCAYFDNIALGKINLGFSDLFKKSLWFLKK